MDDREDQELLKYQYDISWNFLFGFLYAVIVHPTASACAAVLESIFDVHPANGVRCS
jgi:hypothetical protein